MKLATRMAVLCCAGLLAMAAPARADNSVFRLGLSTDANSLDPIVTSDHSSIWAQLLIFDQLVRSTPDGKGLEPGLAERWEMNADGTQYTFHLRDAKFSNGDPVTAGDVVASLDRARGDKSIVKRFFGGVGGIEAVDARTVRVSLPKPFTPLMNNMALFAASVMPAKLVAAQGSAFFDHPVGSGPFMLKSWQRGDKMVLVANPNYWQAGKPHVKEADLIVVGEDNSRVLQLQSGLLDAVLNVPFNQVQALGASGALVAKIVPIFRVDCVLLNNMVKPFDDLRVRLALNYAVDKQGIIDGVLFGNAEQVISTIPNMRYNNDDLKPYPYDPAKAKRLLAEAGVKDLTFTMLVTAGDTTFAQVATAIQANFADVGVHATIQQFEDGTKWATVVSEKYQTALNYIASDTIDPDQLIGFSAVNPERANAQHTVWRNDRVNALYEQERATPDGEKRGAIIKEMEKIIHDNAPVVFLYNMTEPYAYRKNVEGFAVLPTTNWRLEDVVVH